MCRAACRLRDSASAQASQGGSGKGASRECVEHHQRALRPRRTGLGREGRGCGGIVRRGSLKCRRRGRDGWLNLQTPLAEGVAKRATARAGRMTSPTASGKSDAQREQRDRADSNDQDHKSDRVVVEPMSTLYTHDAPRPERSVRDHSCPKSPHRGWPVTCVPISRGWASKGSNLPPRA